MLHGKDLMLEAVAMGAQWKHRIRQASATAKGRAFTKLTKELIVAAKAGADPSTNARLRAAIETAKKASMPRDTLERAIKKGAGLLESEHYETVVYEGFGPHRVPVIVECLTDNAKRTTTNIKHLFRLGQLTPVAWDFEHVGLLEATGHGDPMEAAIECGAQDVEDGTFYTNPADLDAVAKALTARGWTVSKMRLGWRPKNPVTLEDAARGEVEAFLGALDDDDDVQHIYAAM
jgi:YebC/PmpR family DNA-binding regulatory protein